MGIIYHENSPCAVCPRFLAGEMAMSRTGLLLIAHGSRNPDANADLLHVAEALRARGHAIVEPAFLELAAPTIAEAGASCVRQGATLVVLVPYFLSAGVHVRRDLTEACRALAEQFPSARFRLAEPLGPHPLLLEVVTERVRQAIESEAPPC
jgi:sirohydrochlorin ferrochelatase